MEQMNKKVEFILISNCQEPRIDTVCSVSLDVTFVQVKKMFEQQNIKQ